MRYAASIWVDGPARSTIDNLRLKWDSQHAVVRPHLTVVYPQVATVDHASIRAHIQQAFRALPAFEITLDRWADLNTLRLINHAGTDYLTTAFPNFRNPIVLLAGDGARHVLGLRRQLDATFRQPRELLDHPPFVTIGQGLDEIAFREAAAMLSDYRPRLNFQVRAIDLLIEDGADIWKSLGLVHLQGTAGSVNR